MPVMVNAAAPEVVMFARVTRGDTEARHGAHSRTTAPSAAASALTTAHGMARRHTGTAVAIGAPGTATTSGTPAMTCSSRMRASPMSRRRCR
jgi:hypothetical protein